MRSFLSWQPRLWRSPILLSRRIRAAGEFALANRAFLDAVEPQSKATVHELSDQRDQAKTLLHQVQSAFRSGH